MEQELIEALSNVNISSESAELIAEQYFRLQYIEMAVTTVTLIVVFGGLAYGLCRGLKYMVDNS